MPKFKFSKVCGYIRPRTEGEVSDLSEADCVNAELLGLGVRVQETPAPTTEGTPAAPDEKPEEVAEKPSAAPPPEPEPESLACPRGCNNGRQFGSRAALQAHLAQKHGVR